MKSLHFTRRLVVPVITVILISYVIWQIDIKKVLSGIGQFSAISLLIILSILMMNLLIVTIRLGYILRRFGYKLPSSAIAYANISGHAIGLFIISLFGHTFGRQAVLHKYGVSPAFIASISAYERIIISSLGVILCIAGTILLSGWEVVLNVIGHIPLLEIGVAISGGAVFSFLLGRGDIKWKFPGNVKFRKIAGHLSSISSITFISQITMLSAFVIAILSFKPENNILEAYAAAAIISFAASLPITVNGWGIREVVSIYILGQLGINEHLAVSISVMIGICSTLVILIAIPIATYIYKKNKGNKINNHLSQNNNSLFSPNDIEKTSIWIIATVTAILIFFQLHVQLPEMGASVNVNLADPFAILALTVIALNFVIFRKLPEWRIKQFNIGLLALSLMLVFAFFHGVLQIGINQWALSNRLFGWLVIIGYLSSGYLLVSYAGRYGLCKLFEIMIAMGAVIVLIQIGIRGLDVFGIDFGQRLTYNFEGYAANRNAFAFQLMICIVAIFGYIKLTGLQTSAHNRGHYGKVWQVLLLAGILVSGLLFSGSRAGMIAVSGVLFLGFLSGVIGKRHFLLLTLTTAVLIITVIVIVAFMGDLNHIMPRIALINDNERWRSVILGLEMWKNNPILGAGLGVFLHNSIGWLGTPVVIHSTPVWILAEFGILGSLVFGWFFLLLIIPVSEEDRASPEHHILLMLVAGFCIFSLVHEVFYQRMFWLMVGALAGSPLASLRVREQA